MLGRLLLSGFSRLLFLNSFRREIDDPSTVGTLFLLESPNNGTEIITVFCRDLGSNRTHLIDNWVIGHGYGSISSSGVQMIGARRPVLLHVSSILPRTAAFAICAQFT